MNETVQVTVNGTPITITGLDDFSESKGCFADAVSGVGNEEHHLLLVRGPLQQETVLKERRRLNAH